MYYQLFSIHGLVRYENMELGRDADTGGQVKYVIELAEQMSLHESVTQVDIFTRYISDKRVSEDYSKPIEKINDKFRIIRVRCGGRKYMRKELLWPHLDEYIDKCIRFNQKQGKNPDIIHGHYPDAGYVGISLSQYYGVPFVFTGHSLGKPKNQKLLGEGMKEADIERIYKMGHRISVEEEIIQNADLIVTSTQQEIQKQYGMYTNRKLADYVVIPPGVNLAKFYPYYHNIMPDFTREEESRLAQASMMEELERFLKEPEKPLILALSRPDKRKNISGLIDAYGQDKNLQSMANLAIFAGIRKIIPEMEDNEKEVLTQMLLLMDKYDLYGKMAIPKQHDTTYEVPELYRIAAEKKGVFVNIALTEPFGLTLIEATGCGLPVVATKYGGPRDIIENCQNGILVDPLDTEEITKAIKSIISDRDIWKNYSTNGIKNVHEYYSWQAHVQSFISEVEKLPVPKSRKTRTRSKRNPIGNRLAKLKFFLISDIDDTLIGDEKALNKLLKILEENQDSIGFGVASGRHPDSIVSVLEKHNVPEPDVVIASVGSEMYYQGTSFQDKGWQTHISKNWNRKKIKNLLDKLDFLTYQEEETQRAYKISYYMDDKKDRIAMIHDLLLLNKCHYNLIYSQGEFLDILPHRASKGKAIRYLSYKWEIPLSQIMVCGDSGNDEEMLVGNTLGLVVGNHKPELDALKGRRRLYFSKKEYANGILDGLMKYNLMEKSKKNEKKG